MEFEKIILYVYNLSPIKKYRLRRLNKYLEPIGLSNIMLLENKKIKNKTIRRIVFNNSKEYIKNYNKFKKKLEKNFSYGDLHNFYYNSEWVKVYKNSLNLNPFDPIFGAYDHINNKLYFIKNNFKEAINHELFHLSSTDFDSPNESSGFSIDVNGRTFCEGINEGYTDLLTQRYFGEDIEDSYCNEAKLANNLEKIIGKRKMEKLYLNADVFSLIKLLKKYYDIDEIEQFLINVDVLYLYDFDCLSEDEANKINQIVEDCICFLLKGYCKVLKDTNESTKMKQHLIENYFYDMNFHCSLYDKNFKFNMDRINSVIINNLSKKFIINSCNENKVCYNK